MRFGVHFVFLGVVLRVYPQEVHQGRIGHKTALTARCTARVLRGNHGSLPSARGAFEIASRGSREGRERARRSREGHERVVRESREGYERVARRERVMRGSRDGHEAVTRVSCEGHWRVARGS